MDKVSPRPLVAGNWKMNGVKRSAKTLGEIMEGYTPDLRARVDLLVCPPATLVSTFAVIALGSKVAVGGQDCHPKASGAHTGDVSAEMLTDAGATYVIVGHSERRADHGETDALVRAKAEAARRAGLTAIICVGETREEREAGRALDTVSAQIRGSVPPGSDAADTVIAYEPVWAIGTGLTPTAADVAEMHARIRSDLAALAGEEAAGIRILYGGSVKPANARELLSVPNVDGALVGGASLVAADFLAIAAAYRAE
ncbi:triose-phosphate isomerase [Enterovirga aerilata]|uniref:Triosephosphate isomerase n=1 Tax=Enterovirga aerilata TaxID=2730920 RepID=A0A849I3K1_9HYPH|nr:triose-phosphate isomerase [Enterovirga sp. DB1703]NNM71938.1 triose-phosphate isomerase [Enterovirga sp. DB1703]